jgi:hypothetical protein
MGEKLSKPHYANSIGAAARDREDAENQGSSVRRMRHAMPAKQQ